MATEPSVNQVYFVISSAVAYVAFGLIANWYLWPAIKDRPAKVALTPLLLYACLRVNGLIFLMPGLASPDLPSAFAVPTAYGDLASAILALIAIACLRLNSALAVLSLWVFNIVGFCDLGYANFSSFKDHVGPALLGPGYYLAAINVPAMMTVHVVIFIYLLTGRAASTKGVQR
jgi:hypothetical protein